MTLLRPLLAALSCLAVFAQTGEDPAQYVFGTTVVDTSGFEGRVFLLEPDTQKLPKFGRMKQAGVLYTNTLNVWPQSFTVGFPNVSDRFEWFGIEYRSKLWIEKPGKYGFSLLSDDGATLDLNGKTIIDNDGLHAAEAISNSAELTRGVYDLKVEYFQGPRFTVALVLAVAPPGEPWRILDMKNFKPPQDQEEWLKGKVSRVGKQTINQMR
ncbi:MAG: PA14 domain-containing protein [Bryobacteraceae bacterium]|nr:PA14 domain-containing protein [Bryobacteraceae bacterium]